MGHSNCRLLRFALSVVLFLPCLCCSASGQEASEPLLLKGATIYPATGAEPYVGSILIVDGKIKAVGPQVKPPADAKRMELKGFHITPGLIESRGKLWLTEAARSEGNSKAELNIVDGLDPWSEDWRELAASGITSVYVQPASSGTLGGYGGVLRVGPFQEPDQIMAASKSALQAAVGVTGNTSKDRFAQVEALKKQLESARKKLEARKKKAADEKKAKQKDDDKSEGKSDPSNDGGDKTDKQKKPEKESGDSTGQSKPQDEDQDDGDKKDDDDQKSDSDKKEKDPTPAEKAWMQVLEREIPLHVELHHSDALPRVLELADEFEFQLVLDGLSHVASSHQSLVDSPRPVVLGPWIEIGEQPDYRKSESRQWVAAYLDEAKPLWAISGFPSEPIGSRLLRAQAAAAVRHGLPREAILSAITIHPARMLGLGDSTGSIEAGKEADLAIFAGDPLDPSTPIRMVICDGLITHDQECQPRPVTEIVPQSDKDDVLDALPASLSDQYIIQSTRVLQPNGKFKAGKLFIAEGRLRPLDQAGKKVPVYQLGDAVVTPGLVNGHTTLGQADTITDPTESDASHLRAVDAVDPTTEKAIELLHGGFIHAGISPGLTNTSAGLLGHIRLGASDYVAQPAAASQLVLAASARDENRYPASLAGQISMLSRRLNGQTLGSAMFLSDDLSASIEQAKQTTLDQLKSGERPAILVANTDLEIESALQLVETYQLQGAVASTGRLGPFAERIAKLKLGVIVLPLAGTEFGPRLDQYAQLDQAGVQLIFAGLEPEQIRMTATLLSGAGVAPERVLQGLTTAGAAQIGFAATGLKNNSPADLVVWSGNPLDLAATPTSVIVDGKHVPE